MSYEGRWRGGGGEVATTSLSSAPVLGWLRLEHLHCSWQEESLCRREETAGRGGAGSGGGFPLSLSLSLLCDPAAASSQLWQCCSGEQSGTASRVFRQSPQSSSVLPVTELIGRCLSLSLHQANINTKTGTKTETDRGKACHQHCHLIY